MAPTFPAKLLLFGEHTVNLGSHALAVPLPLFSGKWAYAPQLGPEALAAQQQQLPQLADYLDQLQQRGELLVKLDISAFKQALQDGLVFESNIPTGYGAGSSGALVAAVIADYGLRNEEWGANMLELKKALAQIEAFFHGTSSGTDPLVCYLQKPVLLGGKAGVEVMDLPNKIKYLSTENTPAKGVYTIFLLDTGMQRSATIFIEYFLRKIKGKGSYARVHHTLIPDVIKAIGCFLRGDAESVFELFHAISHFQYNYLRGLIPDTYHKRWLDGLEDDLYKLKVCGAGGGGFILGMTANYEATERALAGSRLVPVFEFAG